MADSDDEYRVQVRLRDGEVRQIPAKPGDSVMETIRAAGIDEVLAICGGCCSCGTCHVFVDDDAGGPLPPMSEDEDQVLGFSDFRQANSRLSCQIRFSSDLDGLSVTVAPED